MSKIRTSVNILMKGSATYAKVDHLTLMEINSTRPVLPHAMDQIYRLKAGILHFVLAAVLLLLLQKGMVIGTQNLTTDSSVNTAS